MDSILKKTYFRLILGISFILIATAFAMVISSNELEFCWTSTCLDYFFVVFKTPLKLVGYSFVIIAAAFGYYRLEMGQQQLTMSNRQHQRQLEQDTKASYTAFKEEYMTLLEEKRYQFKTFTITNLSLFKSSFPDARAGNYQLSPVLGSFMEGNENTDLANICNELKYLLSPGNPTGQKYFSQSYSLITGMIHTLYESLPIDIVTNPNADDELFIDSTADYIQQSFQDFYHLVGALNEFMGWHFIDIRELREFRINIANLSSVKGEAQVLRNYVDSSFNDGDGWGHAIMAADEELLRDSFTCNIPQDIMVTLQAQSFITEYLNKQYHVALEADILNTLQELLVATPLERQFMDANKAINVHT